MENQAVYVYAVSIPTTVDSDGKTSNVLDVNGNEYVTIFVHGEDTDERGLFIEPVKAITTLNGGITPLMYAHLLKQMTKNGFVVATDAERKAANVDADQNLVMLKKSVAFAGVVQKRKAAQAFMIDGSDNVGRFVSLCGFGVSEVAIASIDAQFESRMQYYADNDLFIDDADVASYKAGVKAAPTAQLTTVIS